MKDMWLTTWAGGWHLALHLLLSQQSIWSSKSPKERHGGKQSISRKWEGGGLLGLQLLCHKQCSTNIVKLYNLWISGTLLIWNLFTNQSPRTPRCYHLVFGCSEGLHSPWLVQSRAVGRGGGWRWSPPHPYAGRAHCRASWSHLRLTCAKHPGSPRLVAGRQYLADCRLARIYPTCACGLPQPPELLGGGSQRLHQVHSLCHQRAGGWTHLPASPLHLARDTSLVGPRAAFTAVWCRESLRELCLEILSPCQAQFIAYFDICKIDSSVIKRAKILLWIIYNLHLFHSDSSTATLDDLPQIFNQSPAWSFSIGGGTIIQRGGFLLVHQQLVELDEPLQ